LRSTANVGGWGAAANAKRETTTKLRRCEVLQITCTGWPTGACGTRSGSPPLTKRRRASRPPPSRFPRGSEGARCPRTSRPSCARAVPSASQETTCRLFRRSRDWSGCRTSRSRPPQRSSRREWHAPYPDGAGGACAQWRGEGWRSVSPIRINLGGIYVIRVDMGGVTRAHAYFRRWGRWGRLGHLVRLVATL